MRFIVGSMVTSMSMMFGTAALACDGSVKIGEVGREIVTSVPNKNIGDVCLNDLIIDMRDEGANYGSHGEFIVELVRLSEELLKKVRRCHSRAPTLIFLPPMLSIPRPTKHSFPYMA